MYASVARGSQPNTIEPLSLEGAAGLASETLWSFEVGIKTSLFGDKVQGHLAGFVLDWNHRQVSQPVSHTAEGTTFVSRDWAAYGLRGGHGSGFELEITFAPYDWLLVTGAVGYVSRNFSRVSDPSKTLLRAGTAITPAWTASTDVEFRREIASDVTGFIRAEWQFEGGFPDPSSLIGSAAPHMATRHLHVLNFRAGVDVRNMTIAAFVENATNAAYQDFVHGSAGIWIRPHPRTWGLRLTMAFD